MMNHDQIITEKLLIFSRFPRAGQAKTRLIPALGADGAAALQRQLTEATLRVARRAARRAGLSLEIHFTDGSRREMKDWLGADLCYREQGRGNLGERLNRAFAGAFSNGLEAVLALGSDCPGITEEIIHRALTRLKNHDLVLGPSEDGGYYLLGMTAHHPEIFHNQPWGKAGLSQATLAAAARKNLSTLLLEELPDVDRPGDLHYLDNYPGFK